MANEILTEKRGGALIITFNRPDQGNAITEGMSVQLFQALKPVATDPSIRAVMLRGAGGNFMNGLDLGIFSKDVGSGIEHINDVLLPYHSAIRELQAMDKPVLSVVSGMAARAGFSLALASDLVLAGRSARFNAGYASFAMTPDGGASFYLTRKVGIAKATEILMLNEEFDADAAEKLHLVNAVVDDAQLEAKAFEWIDLLANGPTKALGGIKRLVGKAFEQDVHAQLSLEHSYMGACLRSFDFRNAVKAHFTKQPVKFSGA